MLFARPQAGGFWGGMVDALGTLKLVDIGSAEQILKCVDDLTKPCAADIASITLFCSRDNAVSILCALNATANAGKVADAIGGIVYVGSFVYREIRLLRSDYRCAQRRGGKLQVPACYDCFVKAARSPIG